MTSVLAPYRRPGTLYKLAADKAAFAKDTLVSPVIDTERMSATAVICTPAVDWDDEIILPEGVDLETRYRGNPVVFWEHGFIPEFNTPIATSESPEGLLSIKLAGGVLEGTSYFTNKNLQSAQIFDLIVEKIVRATSIHTDPTEAARPEIVDGKRCVIYPKSLMLEWSWCGMGANHEALAKALGRNRLAGSPIMPTLAKSLRQFLPQRRIHGGVWSSEPEENMPTETKPKTLAKSGSEPPPVPPAAPPPADSEPALEEPSTDSPSGQVLGAIHSTIQGLLDNIAAAANTYENPEAISFVTDTLVPALTDLASQVDAAYSACSKGKSMAPTEGETPEVPDEEIVKSWLASNRSRGFQLDGYSARLRLLSAAKNLTPDQRLTVTGIVKHLSDLTAKARETAKPKEVPAEPQVSPELIKSLNDTATLFKSLATDLKAMSPAA